MTTAIDAPATGMTHPAAPLTLEQSGLSLDLVIQLMLKTLHFAGELSGIELAHRLGLSFLILEPAIEAATRQHHCEIVGGSMVGRASTGLSRRPSPPAARPIPARNRITASCTAAVSRISTDMCSSPCGWTSRRGWPRWAA